MIFLLIGLVIFSLWVWSIVDIIQSDFQRDLDKIIWLIVVLTLHFLGSILYYFFGREQKINPPEELV